MAEEEQMKEKYMQFQMLQQQMEQVSQHLEMFNQQLAELDISISAVKELETAEKDNELLAPIADGIFFKAKLIDNQKLVVNVGSNVTVERTVPEVVVLLKEQKEETSKRMQEADEVMQHISKEAMKIYQEVEELQ
jgi:prefoldin alpha subunit